MMYNNPFKIIQTGNLFSNNPHSNSSTNSLLSKNTTSNSSKVVHIQYIQNCSKLFIYEHSYNHTTKYKCGWDGGKLGIWVASGASTNTRVFIKGNNDAKIYLNQSVNYGCTTFLTSLNLPKQNYSVIFNTYGNISSCSDPYEKLILNTTTFPLLNTYYPFVYNGRFAQGNYAGWAVDTDAFGVFPSNIIKENNNLCFRSFPWTNLNNTYFATTADCYYTTKSGNLTSSYFYATKLYLNFKIVSPTNSSDYIEILNNNTPAIIASYNTYYNSTGNYLYRFENASIPLLSLNNKLVRIRIVSLINGITPTNKVRERPLSNFIAISDIHMSDIPWQVKSITSSISIR